MVIVNKNKQLNRLLNSDANNTDTNKPNGNVSNDVVATSGPVLTGDFHDTLVYNVTTKVYRFFINTGIYSDEKWFEPLLKTLSGTTDNPSTTSIEIYLNSPGGSLYTATQIISAINRCKLPVHLYVEGLCASAATIITCGGNFDTITIDKYTEVLIHTARMFTFGKLADVRYEVSNLDKLFDMICDDFYRDVLTKAEIEKVKEGHELYMLGFEFTERLAKRYDKQEKNTKRKK